MSQKNVESFSVNTGKLFKINTGDYLVIVAVGLVCWKRIVYKLTGKKIKCKQKNKLHSHCNASGAAGFLHLAF
jgi:hypothetical protein